MDEMTITDKNGKPKYLVTDKVTDLRVCDCLQPVPETVDSVQECKTCGRKIPVEPTS